MSSSDGNNAHEDTQWMLDVEPPYWPSDAQVPGQRRASFLRNQRPPTNGAASAQQYQPGPNQPQQQVQRPQQNAPPGSRPVGTIPIPDNMHFPSGGHLAYESQQWILDTSGMQYWPSDSKIPGFVVGGGPGKPSQFIPIQVMSMTQHTQQEQQQQFMQQPQGQPYPQQEQQQQCIQQPQVQPYAQQTSNGNFNNGPPVASGSGGFNHQPPRRASAGQAPRRLSAQFAPPINMTGMPMPQMTGSGGRIPSGQLNQNNMSRNNMPMPPQGPVGQQQGYQQAGPCRQNNNNMNYQGQNYQGGPPPMKNQGYVCPPYLQRTNRVKPTFTESALAMIDTFSSYDTIPCNQCDIPDGERTCEPTEPVWVWMCNMLKDVIGKVKDLSKSNGNCGGANNNKNGNTLSSSGGDSSQNPTNTKSTEPTTATASANGNESNLPNASSDPSARKAITEGSNLGEEAPWVLDKEPQYWPSDRNLAGAKNENTLQSAQSPGSSDSSAQKAITEGSNLAEEAPWILEKEPNYWPSDRNLPGSNKENKFQSGPLSAGSGPSGRNPITGGSNLAEEAPWKLDQEPQYWPSDRNLPGSKKENTFQSAPSPVSNANNTAVGKPESSIPAAVTPEVKEVVAEAPVVEEIPEVEYVETVPIDDEVPANPVKSLVSDVIVIASPETASATVLADATAPDEPKTDG